MTALCTAFDRLNELQALWEGRAPRGSETGWPALDRHYTVMPGQWTLVHGVPGHGKSTFIDALMVNMARGPDAWQVVFFSPENFPIERHMARLISKWMMKPFYRKSGRMSSEEFLEGANSIEHAFTWIDPTPKEGEAHDLHWILENAAAAFQAHPLKRWALVVDPYNEVESYRPAGMSETEAIGLNLMMVREFAKVHNCHVFIVAHPQKIYRDRNGERPVPTPWDVSGSSHWFNKSDAVLCVWRDVKDSKDLVEVHVQKIRFHEVGRIGMVELRYVPSTGCFEELKPL